MELVSATHKQRAADLAAQTSEWVVSSSSFVWTITAKQSLVRQRWRQEGCGQLCTRASSSHIHIHTPRPPSLHPLPPQLNRDCGHLARGCYSLVAPPLGTRTDATVLSQTQFCPKANNSDCGKGLITKSAEPAACQHWISKRKQDCSLPKYSLVMESAEHTESLVLPVAS